MSYTNVCDGPAENAHVLATGLEFPEGPVCLADGSVLVVEMRGGTVKRIDSTGHVTATHDMGGGPNGMAIGPDGAAYVCNNGGATWVAGDFKSHGVAHGYTGGAIQRLDLATGAVTTLYDSCDGRRLSAPNDIVFDAQGGFYFSDMGKRHAHHRDHSAVYYALPDGSRIVRCVAGINTANGVGLSPDGRVLYASETDTSRLWAFDIAEPGVIAPAGGHSPNGGRLVCGLPGYQRFDSLAVDAQGNICVATLITGHITVVSPAGDILWRVDMGDDHVTNICFGGPGLRTAFITLSRSGQVVSMPWPVAGLALNFNA